MIEELHTDLQDSPTVKFLQSVPKHKRHALQVCETLNRGLGFIMLPEREFVVGSNKEVTTCTRSRPNNPRLVGHSNEPEGTKLQTNLSRELVIIILGRKDIAFLDDNRLILYLRDAILRIAGNQEKRRVLSVFAQEKAEFIKKIASYTLAQNFAGIEQEAQSVYTYLVKTLKIRPYEERIIQLLSWDWKPQFSLYPYSCRCWILILCFVKLIRLNK